MGFFDLQVNGYGGVDFNADGLTSDALHAVCERWVADGVQGILATVITADLDVMVRRLKTLVACRAADPLSQQLIAGIHIEGPFLNPEPGYIGAHSAQAVRPANVDDARYLLDAAGGLCRLMTLAPEHDAGGRTTRLLVEAGVTVSAGHTNASLETLRAAIDAGLSMFTHVGNGCPATMARHDNIVQRALSLSDRLWCCFIADGVHVPSWVLANYLKICGMDRAVVVTDAISAAGLGPGRYTLGDRAVEVDAHGAARYPGETDHLAGSAATMPHCVRVLREMGLVEATITALTFTQPRRAVGMESIS